MHSDFSYTEQRLIQALLTKKSSADIASIIDKDVNNVSLAIQEYARRHNITSYDQKLAEKEKKKRKKLLAELNRKQSKPVIISSVKKQEQWKYETKTADYTSLVSVRIDNKTFIYIKPGEDAEKAKQNYLHRLKESQEYRTGRLKDYTEVKKFKPLK